MSETDYSQTIAGGAPYVRCSSRLVDSTPWQVRRNLPDQTFVVIDRYATEAEARNALVLS